MLSVVEHPERSRQVGLPSSNYAPANPKHNFYASSLLDAIYLELVNSLKSACDEKP